VRRRPLGACRLPIWRPRTRGGRRENAWLEMERDILKKSALIFGGAGR
jgi:hypothetical protein